MRGEPLAGVVDEAAVNWWNVSVRRGGPVGASGRSRAVGAAAVEAQTLAEALLHPAAFDARRDADGGAKVAGPGTEPARPGQRLNS